MRLKGAEGLLAPVMEEAKVPRLLRPESNKVSIIEAKQTPDTCFQQAVASELEPALSSSDSNEVSIIEVIIRGQTFNARAAPGGQCTPTVNVPQLASLLQSLPLAGGPDWLQWNSARAKASALGARGKPVPAGSKQWSEADGLGPVEQQSLMFPGTAPARTQPEQRPGPWVPEANRGQQPVERKAYCMNLFVQQASSRYNKSPATIMAERPEQPERLVNRTHQPQGLPPVLLQSQRSPGPVAQPLPRCQ
ncbi:hypothetical protein MDA_GLEAN10002208 [Myotis davidii]|uniref:Uncharacterized protein n=1 Tax=Myotis davidii TaxID=225400 RepID=L5MIQ1_MYODS|nr:hypothetical protein MDA_GLEAN10002208 [Myotis davidii]